MARVLVVDDEPTLLATLRFNLEREGYEVIVAADGAEALMLAEQEQPDLVLLDLMLPGMHGFEICRALRKRTSIPIVILTARTEEVDRVVGLELGADDLKPKEFDLLVILMRNRGQVLTREQLLLRVWRYESLGSSRTVDVHIARLRQKIEEDPDRPVRIVTTRGAGYRFEA